MKNDSNWLIQFSKNIKSQFGEDGIIEKIFETIGIQNKWCIEFGALDGAHDSNTWNLIKNKNWQAVLIEPDLTYFERLRYLYKDESRVTCINKFVSFDGEETLDNILSKTLIPTEPDLISIDIDGNDYHIWNSLKLYSPRVVIIEYNPTIPNDICFIQPKDMNVYQGSSAKAIVELGRSKGYELVAVNESNLFFVKKNQFKLFSIVENSLDKMRPNRDFETRLFQLYDGTLVLDGYDRLMWHNVKITSKMIQVLPKRKRFYPAKISGSRFIRYIKYLFRRFPLIFFYRKLKNQNRFSIFSNGSIGDFLMAIQMAKMLYESNKNFKIILFVSKNKDLLEIISKPYPYIHLYNFNPKSIFTAIFIGFISKTSSFTLMSFDKIPFKIKFLAKLIGIRGGYFGFNDKGFCLTTSSIDFDYNKLYINNLFNLVKLFGVEKQPEIGLDFIRNDSILKDNGLKKNEYIVIHPFAASEKRTFPEIRVIEFLSPLAKKYPQFIFVVTGSASDSLRAESIVKEINLKNVIYVCNRQIDEVVTLINDSKLFVGVDSGNIHIAGLLKKATVEIGNFSNPTWLVNYNQNALVLASNERCSCDKKKGGNCILKFNDKEYYRCMLDISANDIIVAFEKLLNKLI